MRRAFISPQLRDICDDAFLTSRLWLVFSRFPPADLSDTSAPTGKGFIYKRKGLEGNVGKVGPVNTVSPGCFGRQPHTRQENMYRWVSAVGRPSGYRQYGRVAWDSLRVGQTYGDGIIQGAWGCMRVEVALHTHRYIHMSLALTVYYSTGMLNKWLWVATLITLISILPTRGLCRTVT